MKEYLNIFIDKDYPDFIDKYLETKTLKRLKDITQFCGCDYTKLYSPLFTYTRYFHSLVVAHMTWHFTRDKKETIAALLHDVGTPCFAHSIDCVFGDYIEQESSEVKITTLIKKDKKLMDYLKDDEIELKEIDDYSKYHILENKSPRLCTDRLDGVLHTVYVWLHTNKLEEIKEVFDDLIVLENEDGYPEIGFESEEIALKFVRMVLTYALELQGNHDKFVTKYVADMVKLAFNDGKLDLSDLYSKKEKDICKIFADNYSSWEKFTKATKLLGSDKEVKNHYYTSYEIKKRNAIPLVKCSDKVKRIIDVSKDAKELYEKLDKYHDFKYAYLEEIEDLT